MDKWTKNSYAVDKLSCSTGLWVLIINKISGRSIWRAGMQGNGHVWMKKNLGKEKGSKKVFVSQNDSVDQLSKAHSSTIMYK